MLALALQFIAGLLYANAGEWFMHKYILHALGQQQHHAVCAKNGMIDPGYQSMSLTSWNTQSKELVVLAGIVLLNAPLFMLSPTFTCALYGSLALYYYKHRKAHLDPEWAKRYLRWHYEHHLGENAW